MFNIACELSQPMGKTVPAPLKIEQTLSHRYENLYETARQCATKTVPPPTTSDSLDSFTLGQ